MMQDVKRKSVAAAAAAALVRLENKTYWAATEMGLAVLSGAETASTVFN